LFRTANSANLSGMKRPRPSNDNKPNAPPHAALRMGRYRAAAQARWVGRVIASSADGAFNAAAVEFRTDMKKLIAVRRYEIAS
jgi:hypothetical protein